MGHQQIPTNFRLASPEQVAMLVGEGTRWSNACERYERLVTKWPALTSVLPRCFDVLADYGVDDFERLCSLISWLEQNPKSDFYIRQLPIEGLDTKWIERRKGVVTDLVRAMRSASPESDFFAVCGLRHPRHRIRVRLLCPALRQNVGGLEDIEAPLQEIAALPISPASVVIVENLETGLALPDLPGVVAFMKLGNAVSLLNGIPWMADLNAIYWGDIDTHGYAILERARHILPRLKSILMDEETLLKHRSLCVEEPIQNGPTELPLLTDHERAVYEGLRSQTWGRNLRLEQERIPWVDSLRALGNVFRRK